MWHNFKDEDLTPEERQKARLTIDQMQKIWPIFGPIVAVVTNFKALVIILAVILWFQNPKIVAFFQSLMEGK